MCVTPTLPTDPRACSTPDRLRWIAELLDLAGRAISIIACVQGIEYSEQLHAAAEEDLRAWARWLDATPDIAVEMDVVRLVLGAKADDNPPEPSSHSKLSVTRFPPSTLPPEVVGEGPSARHSSYERGLNVAPCRAAGA